MGITMVFRCLRRIMKLNVLLVTQVVFKLAKIYAAFH